jgi:hypothetical protein
VSEGRADALALLLAWRDADTELRCELRFTRFAACFRGRIRLLTVDRLEVLSDDTRSELALPLSRDITIALGAFVPSLPPDDAAEYGRIVTVTFDDAPPGDELALIEVRS